MLTMNSQCQSNSIIRDHWMLLNAFVLNVVPCICSEKINDIKFVITLLKCLVKEKFAHKHDKKFYVKFIEVIGPYY